jgi:hypothetical protein
MLPGAEGFCLPLKVAADGRRQILSFHIAGDIRRRGPEVKWPASVNRERPPTEAGLLRRT